jgi:hypothetical protein
MEPVKAQNQLVEEGGKKYDPVFAQALIQAILTKNAPATM